MAREIIEFDVVIVGAGPAGLAAACRLGQLARATGTSIEVCVVEKGAEVGSHIISGAVFEPRALTELFDDWSERGAPVEVPVGADRLFWLADRNKAWRLPRGLVPRSLRNDGNYIISLGALCRWLAQQAEAYGCNVLSGFAVTSVLVDAGNRVVGVITGDRGFDRNGKPKPGAESGYELRAKYVIFAEGCRGSLMHELEARFALRGGADPQHYGIAFKEIWEVDPARHELGRIDHTLGWPLGTNAEGGGFIYHAERGSVSVGLVVSLNYRNPSLDPFEEFQRWKHHPLVSATLAGGRRIAYGARAVNRGGLQSLPKLTMPGGLLVGCEAGFLVPAKIKGTHTALKSGMLAAESIHAAMESGDPGGGDLRTYTDSVRASWLWEELASTRNFAPSVSRFGSVLGGALTFVEQNLLRRSLPFTLRNARRDRDALRKSAECERIVYSAPDSTLSFDRLSSVYLANTQHEENQPQHLLVADASLPVGRHLADYDEPAQRYCPAGVYEIVREADGERRFQINAANCIHCKTCDIKDPSGNIRWVPPEGGSGPNYVRM